VRSPADVLATLSAWSTNNKTVMKDIETMIVKVCFWFFDLR
jgi:hypothetical protein